jgi:hypothetical protein
MHFDPPSSFQTAQRRVGALPGASDLEGKLLLSECEPDDAIMAPLLVSNTLAARRVMSSGAAATLTRPEMTTINESPGSAAVNTT